MVVRMKTAAIVLSAGQGKRMGTGISKQYLMLKEKPILYYSLKAFEDSFIDEIILVVGKGDVPFVEEEIVRKYHFKKIRKIVEGGKERYHSVYQGLCALDDNTDTVFIHDGARPFVTEPILERAKNDVEKYSACVVGMPVKDTIKVADETGFIHATPKRDLVWMIQTPQVFQFELVKKCYDLLIEKEEELSAQGIKITDDSMVVEYFSDTQVHLTTGSYENIKITTPEDLLIAEIFLSE